MNNQQLIDKYHVPAPRYTSYPTVPYWDAAGFDEEGWIRQVRHSFKHSNDRDGISLYIHLPFCESLCTYCGCNTRITRNHGVEQPYIQALLKEWEIYQLIFQGKPLIRELHLGGGTPTFFKPENLKMLIEGILAPAVIHPEAEFSFEAHPGNTTEAHLRVLHSLGFRRLSLGIQDFDPKVQLVINRIQTVEEVAQVTDLARLIGYTSVNYDLIYGLPLQDAAGLQSTIESVLELTPDRIAFYSYAHVPWVKPGQRRYTEKDLPDANEKQKLYELGRDMLKQGGYYEIGMDHFTLELDSLYAAEKDGRLHRNFMGYTHQYSELMIGLGVSSISDSWTAFAQNVKKVEEYLELVNAGRLPLFKGHLLNAEDLVIRRHILNLMCTGRTSWAAPEQQTPSLWEGLLRMRLIAEDGLVVMDENQLQVTPEGKRFLRNICMALDARLWANQPQTQLFSMAG
ncbi:oxygen-independent coproporphyrinogen III oxidase [Pedobacter sp. MC2016-15]|uniref:oxygen-independent coproporphyrinogen III oxidase n=1 Tax=Pedobacter sp. MC2016-15 TaxID=2994473 RepID=UPI00224856E8|nr:oxygen-independent coproporphyrinogen III oxidase [Pedobacter sp. MC2016-15]MCX2480068.1 oxygen-independent coproporphyrinogen III oxidase [Pedobacter sp. MC2016-15]